MAAFCLRNEARQQSLFWTTDTELEHSFPPFLLVNSHNFPSNCRNFVTVEAEENLQEYIITEVKGDKLKIYTEDGVSLKTSRNKDIIITVPFKDLEAVNLAGSGDVTSKDVINAQDFKCSVSGSGDMILEVNAQDVTASVAGSGDLSIGGSTQKSHLKVAGSGDLHASDLKSNDAEASIAGSGDISLNCNGGTLKAAVAGSGDIVYTGKPDKVDSKVVGSGSVSN